MKLYHLYGTTAVEGFGCVMSNVEVGERFTARVGAEIGRLIRVAVNPLAAKSRIKQVV
jgi:hypothetical protein